MKNWLFVLIVLIASFPAASQTPAPQAQQAPTAAAPAAQPSAAPKGDPLLDVPPLPAGKVTLVGGTVDSIDRVRNRLTVKVFGGGKMKMFFDDRTHIYRNGVETTMMGIRKDERVYVDTQLDGTRVFARNIRINANANPADARGQLAFYDRKTGRIVVRDDLSSRPVAFVLAADAKVKKGDSSGSLKDVREGSLVAVRFTPQTAESGIAHEIEVIAQPGDSFSFAGVVTHLDLRHSMFAIRNKTDGKRYDIYFDPSADAADQLGIGVNASVSTTFDGARYTARTLEVTPAEAAADAGTADDDKD